MSEERSPQAILVVDEVVRRFGGLTAVHVNRSIRALEEAGILERTSQRQVRVADWPRMQAFADFDPDYLHLAA